MIESWYLGIVLHGKEKGRLIGFPTINLDPAILPEDIKAGVYGCTVKYKNLTYLGALYVGPRYIDSGVYQVLEIHILNFNRVIYGEQIYFRLGEYIRPPLELNSLDLLKKQIKEDILAIKNVM